MSWSPSQFPERPYAYVPEEKLVDPRNPGPWAKVAYIGIMVTFGLIMVAIATSQPPEPGLYGTSENTTDAFLNRCLLLLGLAFINAGLGAYYFTKPWNLPTKREVRFRVAGIGLAGAVIGLLFANVDDAVQPTSGWVDAAELLIFPLASVAFFQFALWPIVAYRRNRAQLSEFWAWLRS